MSERIKRNYIDEHECAWVDLENNMHIDAVKLCKVLGYPPTSENQDIVEAVAMEVATKNGIPSTSVSDLL